MNHLATIVFPVFAMIGIGYLTAKSKVLVYKAGDALSDFVFVIAIPMLLLRTLATANLSGISAWQLWAPFFAGFILAWWAGTNLNRRLFGHDSRSGLVAGLAAGYGNTTLVGLPLVSSAFGHTGLLLMVMIIAVQMPIMMGATAILMERAERMDAAANEGHSFKSVARSLSRNLIRNPIIIALAVGALWQASGVPFTGLPAEIIGRLADISGPLALFVLGMALSHYDIRDQVAASLLISGLKLIVMPALVLLLALAVKAPLLTTKIAVLAAACPTGVTPFMVANRFKTSVGLASNTMTLSTFLGVFSIAYWLHILDLVN